MRNLGWEGGKNTNDYHVYFDQWWRRDLASMVRRDINHPSIVMWSIGNEIPMRESAKGYELARELAAEVRSIDPSRAVTSAVPMVKDKDEPFLEALDVGAYHFPTRSTLNTRSRYSGYDTRGPVHCTQDPSTSST